MPFFPVNQALSPLEFGSSELSRKDFTDPVKGFCDHLGLGGPGGSGDPRPGWARSGQGPLLRPDASGRLGLPGQGPGHRALLREAPEAAKHHSPLPVEPALPS